MTPSTDRYTRTAVALHWLVAVAVLANIALAWYMHGVPKEPPGLRAGWFNLHKSIGITIALLVLVRLAWRARHPAPPLRTVSPWQQRAASGVHALLYACLLLQPLSGFLGSLWSGRPIRFFGWTLAQSAEWPAANRALGGAHEAIAWILATLIAVHVAAALWHALHRDGVLGRMAWPARPGSTSA